MDVNLIWCHGSKSQPWANKSKSLADAASDAGFTMDALDFQDLPNPDDRVARLVENMQDSGKPSILAGSSMGGYVASAAAKQADVLGLFLLAPAFYLPGYDMHVFSNLPPTVTVLHGWNDDVVPVENSIRFAKLHKADLHILNDGHRLAESVDDACRLFTSTLNTIKTQLSK